MDAADEVQYDVKFTSPSNKSENSHLARNVMDFSSTLTLFKSEGPRRPIDVSKLINLSCDVTSLSALVRFSRNAFPLAEISAHAA